MNDEAGLALTINSVLEQDYPNIQFIIIDGDSKDGSRELLESHASALDYWVSEPDNGLYDAMNKGVRQCNGDFCVFMNAGDRFLHKDSLSRVAQAMSKREIAYFTQIRIIDKRNRATRLVPPENVDIDIWIKDRNPNHQSVFFPRAYYEHNFYDTSFTINADGDYMLRCFRTFSATYIPLLNIGFELGGLSNAYDDIKVVRRWIADRKRLYAMYYPQKKFKYFKSTIRPYLIYYLKKLLGGNYFGLMKFFGRYD